VVGLWSSLPQKVHEANSLYVFKKVLDVALVAKGIKGCGARVGAGVGDLAIELDDQP